MCYYQPEINALALPTKQIFVYSGLVDLVEDDTLLAAVLGHEIAHAVERHAVENVRLPFSFFSFLPSVFLLFALLPQPRT